MLVLARKTNDSIVGGDGIRIKVVDIKGNCVRLRIEAPADVRILRGELTTTIPADRETTDEPHPVLECAL